MQYCWHTWNIRNLERLGNVLGLKVPDLHCAIVQTAHHPWLGRVQIHALDAIRPRGELPLQMQDEYSIRYFYLLQTGRLYSRPLKMHSNNQRYMASQQLGLQLRSWQH